MDSPKKYLPYGRHTIDNCDISAVSDVLHSNWLTTGPRVEEFEKAMATFCGIPYAVSVNSGTAALHTMLAALGIGPGDEVIVPAITFVATANAVVMCGGVPVFADVDSESLLISPQSVSQLISNRTRAVLSVDYAGQPCAYDELNELTQTAGIPLVADASHSLGGHYGENPVGGLALASTFSFHPVKNMTTGEGGLITTEDRGLAARMKRFRNHGIDRDHIHRANTVSWEYDMLNLGYNYRLSDFQCALGISQLERLPQWVKRRSYLAERYSQLLINLQEVTPLKQYYKSSSAWHLYVVRVDPQIRRGLFEALRNDGIGVNVHYRPVYLNSYYRKRFGYSQGLCPIAESVYEEILSLPLFPGMQDSDVNRTVDFLAAYLA